MLDALYPMLQKWNKAIHNSVFALKRVSFSGCGPWKEYQFSFSYSLRRVSFQEPLRHTPIQNSRKYPFPLHGAYGVSHKEEKHTDIIYYDRDNRLIQDFSKLSELSSDSVREVIYQTRETVFHRDIQTPKRELKIRCAAVYFWRNSRCLDSRWNTVSSVWYIFSN